MYNPGSREARDAGCKCPVMDNNYGEAPPWPSKEGEPEGWWIREGCEYHTQMAKEAEEFFNNKERERVSRSVTSGPMPVSELDMEQVVRNPPVTASGITFHPWSDGWAVGVQIKMDGYQDSFVYLSPDETKQSTDEGDPAVKVYMGHVDYDGTILAEVEDYFVIPMLPCDKLEVSP
jgi:hypothetical protein